MLYNYLHYYGYRSRYIDKILGEKSDAILQSIELELSGMRLLLQTCNTADIFCFKA